MFFWKKSNDNSETKAERLYDMYSSLMYMVAYDILKDKAAAEDAVSEAFIKMIDNLDRITEEDCPYTRNFLVVICRNVAIDMYNRRKKESLFIENELLPIVSDTYNPERILISKEAFNDVVEALESLDVKYRDVVLLAKVYNMSNEEIAKTIGLTTDAVKKRLQRAKKMIAAKVAEKEKQNIL